jgi:hypothetical protein
MAVILTVPSNTYSVGTQAFSPTLASNRREIKAEFSTTGWPAGDCLRITLTFPGGASAGSVTFTGGLNRFGQALCAINVRSKTPNPFLAQGTLGVSAQVLQPITTTITVSDA